MTDEQIIRHYERCEVYQRRQVERYWTDPDYRARRRMQNADAARRYRQRLRQIRRVG